MGADPLRRESPLRGRRIVVTRPRAQAGSLVDGLAELGAEVLSLPTIRITSPSDPGLLAGACDVIDRYDWIVFTSMNGVERFMRVLRESGKDPEALKEVAIAAVGPATAEVLAKHGLRVNAVPEEHVGEAVAEAMRSAGEIRGRRVLLPRAEEARDALPALLTAAGAHVDDVPAYRTVTDRSCEAEIRRAFADGTIDMVVFTSGSTVRAFMEMAGDLLRGARIASIGPITSGVVAELGHEVAVEAPIYTAEGLLSAIREYYTRSS